MDAGRAVGALQVSDHDDTVASNQLRREILNIISRYGSESDVTIYQILGVLTIIQHDMIDALESKHKSESDE